jgi:uncharacterized membrane protein (DUF4010 family)
VAGLRTFGLLGLLGGVAGLVARALAPSLAAVLLAGAVAALFAGYLRGMRISGGVSATSLIVSLLTLCLGLLAVSGYALIAAATAAVVTLVLVSRTRLHAWLTGLDEVDVQATGRFAILTAVILPLLPDRRFGPYDAWNPRELWLVVILVTGFSFAGYIANKRFGTGRGTLATAAIGGLYSSTAVTASLSRRLKEAGSDQQVLAAGIAVASTLMFMRVLVLTAMLATPVVPTLALLLAPAALIALGACALALKGATRAGDGSAAMAQRNPFELLPALGFAALVAAMALGTRWAAAAFGDAGIATLVAITGSFDVDAAIVTVGGLPSGTLDPRTAALVLAVPVLLNTLFKALIVITSAGWTKGRRAATPLALSAVAIMIALAVLVI